jgi:hypothetical protein
MKMSIIIEGQIKDLKKQLKIIKSAERTAARQEKAVKVAHIKSMIKSSGMTIKEFIQQEKYNF